MKLDQPLAAFSLRSLRGRLALLLGLALLPTGVLALQSGLTAGALRDAAAQEEVASIELLEMAERATGVQRIRTVTRAVAANAVVASSGVRTCNALLSGLDTEFSEFSAVVILDARARVRCAADAAAVGRVTASQDFIDRAARRDDVLIEFVPNPTLTAAPVLAAIAPIRGADGLFAGVSRESLSLLARTNGQAAKAGGFAALVDGGGRVLQVDGLAPTSATVANLREAMRDPGLRARGGPFRVAEKWAVASQVLDLDLYLVHGWAPPTAGAVDWLRTLWALAAPLFLWLAAVGVTWWAFESYVARPLSTLETLARAYARGDETATPTDFQNAPEEFLSLRRTLAAMAKTLRGREKRIAEALQEERALLLEVNHRVKNNLQVVASILSILSRAAENEQQATGLARAQERIQLLALAQNEIHSSGAVHSVRLDKLAGDICDGLTLSRGARASNIKVTKSFAAARTTADYAAPFAFLIGESLLQALDALANMGPARIDLSLTLEESGVSFTITSPDLNAATVAPPIAHRIIDGFTQQIGATVEYAQSGAFVTRILLHNTSLEKARALAG